MYPAGLFQFLWSFAVVALASTSVLTAQPKPTEKILCTHCSNGSHKMTWGKLDDALSDFTKAIEANPNDADAYYYRGQVKQRKNDLDGAIADFTKAIELEPNNDSHYRRRAWAKYAKSDHTGALDDFTKVIEMDPKDAEAYYSRAQFKFHTDDLDGAIADYTRAIELKPKYADAYRARSEAKAAKNDNDGQFADLNKTIEYDATHAKDFKQRGTLRLTNDLAGAKADWIQALKLAPLDPEPHAGMALASVFEKDFAGVIAFSSRAIEIDPKFGDAFAWRAYAYSETGDTAKADADVQQAVRLGTKNVYTFVASARAKTAKSDIDGAIVDYSQALTEDSLLKETIYFERAQCHDAKTNYKEAIADYSKVIELDPKHESAYTLRSIARHHSGDFEGALADSEGIIKISAESAENYVFRGIMLQKKGSLNNAISDFNRAIELDPKYSHAFLNRGRVLVKKGQLEAAHKDFTTAIELNKQSNITNIWPHYERGRNLVFKGDAKGALADLAVALKTDPRHPLAIWFRAAAKLMNGETNGAIYDFQLYQKLKPGSSATAQFLIFLHNQKDKESMDELKESMAGWRDDWKRVIAQFLLDEIHESLVFALAEKGDAKTVREHQCEAFYYAGMVRLLKGDKNGAKALFEKCTALGVTNFVEHGFAEAELARLKARPKVY